MGCPICRGPEHAFARGTVLGDQAVAYLQCGACGLVRAEEPTWLARSYSEPIARLDIGLLARCSALANITSALIRSERLRAGRMLDWGGGYGTLTRLMRDRGYDFRHYDPLVPNIFARGFEADPGVGRYVLTTAIEVLEHLGDPVDALGSIAAGSDILVATTEILPEPAPHPGQWWYYTPETGQHITFYTRRALGALAGRLGFGCVVTGPLVHVFSRRPLARRSAALVRAPRAAYLLGAGLSLADRRYSLTASDVERAREASVRGVAAG